MYLAALAFRNLTNPFLNHLIFGFIMSNSKVLIKLLINKNIQTKKKAHIFLDSFCASCMISCSFVFVVGELIIHHSLFIISCLRYYKLLPNHLFVVSFSKWKNSIVIIPSSCRSYFSDNTPILFLFLHSTLQYSFRDETARTQDDIQETYYLTSL